MANVWKTSRNSPCPLEKITYRGVVEIWFIHIYLEFQLRAKHQHPSNLKMRTTDFRDEPTLNMINDNF